MNKQIGIQTQQVIVEEAVRTELKPPSLYFVVLLNDDYTPMDFVVDVVQKYFALSLDAARRIMWQVHNEGKGVCGVFTRDIAETKAYQVNTYARMNEHPLLCKTEKA